MRLHVSDRIANTRATAQREVGIVRDSTRTVVRRVQGFGRSPGARGALLKEPIEVGVKTLNNLEQHARQAFNITRRLVGGY